MSRLLKLLEQFDDNVAVGQVISKLKQDEISAQQKETEEIDKVKKDFKNVYLKRIYDCDLFGETLQVFHILEITETRKTIDYETVYNYKGNKLSFEANGINFQTIDGDDVYHSFYEEELRKMTVIGREEYNVYNNHYSYIKTKLIDLIKL